MKWVLLLWIMWGGYSGKPPMQMHYATDAACYKALEAMRITLPASADENEWVVVAVCQPMEAEHGEG